MSYRGHLPMRGGQLHAAATMYDKPQREVMITGPVLQHYTLAKGHWWWKQWYSTILVGLTDEGRELLNQALQSVELPRHAEDKEWVGVAVPETELWRFPEGSNVEVLLGLNSPSRDFYLAITMRYVISARNIEGGEALMMPSVNGL